MSREINFLHIRICQWIHLFATSVETSYLFLCLCVFSAVYVCLTLFCENRMASPEEVDNKPTTSQSCNTRIEYFVSGDFYLHQFLGPDQAIAPVCEFDRCMFSAVFFKVF